MLQINHASKHFGTKRILDTISLTVHEGEIAVLLGESGVGKSTLLRALNNLERLDSGTVILNGIELDLSNVNKTHTVGMVFQHFNLFEHLTVQENITLALIQSAGKTPQEAEKIAHALLQQYGLADKSHSYIKDLSGGQKQRLALARTLALEPKIVCLDEPTSALDPLLTNYVASIIQDLAHKKYIVLVATHDVAILEKMNCTIYLMKHGKIVEQARSADFFQNKTNYPLIARFVSGTHT